MAIVMEDRGTLETILMFIGCLLIFGFAIAVACFFTGVPRMQL